MILPIQEVPEGRSNIQQQVSMTEQQIEDGNLVGTIKCNAQIDRLQHQMFVCITYQATVAMECSRCTKQFNAPVSGEYTVVLQQTDFDTQSDEENEGIDLFFSENDRSVDMRQTLYDEIMISLSMQPLCKPECTGVNPLPAKNTTEFTNESFDPRWSALMKLKNKKDNK